MTHVAHSAAANAAVVATHSTAAKVKPASATTAASPTQSWSMLVEDLRSKVGLAFAGSCVAANRATPLAYRILFAARAATVASARLIREMPACGRCFDGENWSPREAWSEALAFNIFYTRAASPLQIHDKVILEAANRWLRIVSRKA